jgi:hypothetical protein
VDLRAIERFGVFERAIEGGPELGLASGRPASPRSPAAKSPGGVLSRISSTPASSSRWRNSPAATSYGN